jgi:hypothetical protein
VAKEIHSSGKSRSHRTRATQSVRPLDKKRTARAKKQGREYVRPARTKVTAPAPVVAPAPEPIRGSLDEVLQTAAQPEPRTPVREPDAATQVVATYAQIEASETRARLLATSLGDDDLEPKPTKRVRELLDGEGIKTLGDLVSRSARDLGAIASFGPAALKEVKALLSANNLHLKGD